LPLEPEREKLPITLNKVGYCPWCGSDKSIEAYYPGANTFEWELCRTPRCRGGYELVITDIDGFVLQPETIRDRYVFTRPLREI
jgi:hypothetical protein